MLPPLLFTNPKGRGSDISGYDEDAYFFTGLAGMKVF